MLEKALAETDPETTDVVVMTAKSQPAGRRLDGQRRTSTTTTSELMTAVVDAGGEGRQGGQPLIVPTNNPLFAIVNTAKTSKCRS